MRRVFLLLTLLVVAGPLIACAPNQRGQAPFGSGGGERYAMPVADAQRGLTQLGFQPGPIDGLYGPQTRQAILNYQRVRGIPVTGRIDDRFAASLRSDLQRGSSPRVDTRPAPPGSGPVASETLPAPGPQTSDTGGTGLPGPDGTGESGTDVASAPVFEPAPQQSGPLPDLVYRQSGHDPALIAATNTRPEHVGDVRYAMVDLDGDGDRDVVWNNTNSLFCGTAGCSFDVYFNDGGSWRPVARLLAFEVDAGTGRTGGVRDLVVTGRRGSTVWKWLGTRYAPA